MIDNKSQYVDTLHWIRRFLDRLRSYEVEGSNSLDSLLTQAGKEGLLGEIHRLVVDARRYVDAQGVSLDSTVEEWAPLGRGEALAILGRLLPTCQDPGLRSQAASALACLSASSSEPASGTASTLLNGSERSGVESTANSPVGGAAPAHS